MQGALIPGHIPVIPGADDSCLRPMTAQVLLSPRLKFGDSQALGQFPVFFAEIPCRVFGEKAGLLNDAQGAEIFIRNRLILLLFFVPGVDQVFSGNKFALETAGARRIIAADLELAGAFHQAVCYPALKRRVIVNESAGRKIERIAVRNPVTGVDFASAGDYGK